MEKIIVAFAGKIASGKSSLSEWLARTHGFELVSIAEPIYIIAKALYGSDSREILINISTKIKKFDKYFWLYFTKGKIDNSESRLIVIDDIRYPEEVLFFKKFYPTIVILLKVDPETAWKRLLARGSEKDKDLDKQKFLELFNKDNSVDEIEKMGLFDLAIDTSSLSLEREKEIIEKFLKARRVLK